MDSRMTSRCAFGRGGSDDLSGDEIMISLKLNIL